MSYDQIDNLFAAEAAAISKRKAEALKALEARTDLNDHGRRQHQDRIDQEFGDERRKAARDHADKREERRQELIRSLHRQPGRQTAEDVVSMRNALSEVNKIRDGRAARTALQMAQRTGDDVMVRAIGIRALNVGWNSIVNDCAEAGVLDRDALAELDAMNETASPSHRVHRDILGSLGITSRKAQQQGDGSAQMNAALRRAVGVHTDPE